MRHSEKAKKADDLVNQIGEMVCQIQELEKELIDLRVTDVCQYNQEKYNPNFLWSNLGLLQTHGLSHLQDLSRAEEDPCFASLALLEELLKTIHQSVLQMQGCYIRTQGKTVSMNISFSTSLENLVRTSESYPLPARNK